MKLNVRTRGQSESQGKPRVYLTCHPDDVDTAFPLVCEDLLRHVNCAVWYDAEQAESYAPAELYAALDEMQLVVLAVTSKFLYTENRARDVELPYALSRHLPVLPVMLESGLSREFNRVTETRIQVANRCVNDPTATPYDDVLDNYLRSVLVGDELAEQVRNAFDAYVFLSYRKKDRRHAQRLMHLIHENKQFRDIAIWYDEFLVPGEKYSEAIRDAMKKSGLFALAVTPNLLEPDNYVMREEYPKARSRKLADGDLEIIPVELYDTAFGDPRTDQQQLRDAYEGIPAVQDEHQRNELNAVMIAALDRIARKENDGSARHRFFIGLAYLCGIDMEINRERALELIQSAATDEDPCFDATEKLVDMFLTGDGVARDERTAIAWQRKLCEQYRAAYEVQHDPDEHKGFGTKYFRALIALSDMLRTVGEDEEAFTIAGQALAFGYMLEKEVGAREVERDTAVICNRLGGLCRDRGDLNEAENYYLRSMGIYRRLAQEIGTARARRDLSVSLERLGDISRKRRDYQKAEEYYEQARDIRTALSDHGGAGARRDLSAILTKLGNVRRDRKDYGGAASFYEEALQMDRMTAEELKTVQSRDDHAVSLVKLADIRRKQEQYVDAAGLLTEAVNHFTKNVESTGSLQYRKNLATALEKLADAEDGRGDRERAGDCYRKALGIREQLAAEYPSHTSDHELAVCCFRYGEFRKDAKMTERALKIWEGLCKRHPEYRQYAENARRTLEALR